jgi:hypothetical protein
MYVLPPEIQTRIQRLVRIQPWVRESRKIEEEKLVIVKLFNPGGSLQFSMQWKDGKPHGLLEVFYKNGQLSTRHRFDNGESRGVQESYNSDGEQCYYFVV